MWYSATESYKAHATDLIRDSIPLLQDKEAEGTANLICKAYQYSVFDSYDIEF
jgi:hypothetical protein